MEEKKYSGRYAFNSDFDPDTYQEAAIRFASEKSMETKTSLLVQGALGLCGEAAETLELYRDPDTIDHARKELGDILWYIATTAYAVDVKLSDLMWLDFSKYHIDKSEYTQADAIFICIGKISDIVKKIAFHGHELTDTSKFEISIALSYILGWLRKSAMEDLDCSIEDIMVLNIRKLSARYPDGHFDPEKSMHRKEGDI